MRPRTSSTPQASRTRDRRRRSRSPSPSSPACTSRPSMRRTTAATRSGRALDAVLLAEVQVDRALVDGRVGALALDLPEQVAALAVDDDDLRRCRPSAARSAPAGWSRPFQTQPAGRGSSSGRTPRARVPPARGSPHPPRDRRLERGGEDVLVEDPRVRVVEDRRLDAPRRGAPPARA